MMPFILGDKKSLPHELQHYHPLIEQCKVEKDQYGKVLYLTVQEGMVTMGRSQRRPGIHTDADCSPDAKRVFSAGWGGGWGGGSTGKSNLFFRKEHVTEPYKDMGVNGGIYIATSVPNSCQVFNKIITHTNRFGDCDYERQNLGNPTIVEPNTIYWMTDRTPHESLILGRTTYRQFFRLVTSDVAVWFANHNTPNPLGIKPDCIIMQGDKFKDAHLYKKIEEERNKVMDKDKQISPM
jgi:hypothetical protein